MKPMEAEQHQAVLDMAKIMLTAHERVEQMNIEDPELAAFVEGVAVTGALVGAGPDDWRYRNYHDLILDLSTGPRRATLELPEGVELGEVSQCYRNSWELATEFPDDYIYVEGYAYHSVLPVQHAWVQTPDGRIIDPTWCNPAVREHGPGHALYLGVAFDDGVLTMLSLETGWASVFGADPEVLDCRALRYGFTTDEGLVIGANGPEDM